MRLWVERFTACNWQNGDADEVLWVGVYADGPCASVSMQSAYQVLYVEPLRVESEELTAADRAEGAVAHYVVGPRDPAYRYARHHRGDLTVDEWTEWKSNRAWIYPDFDLRLDLLVMGDGEWVVDADTRLGYHVAWPDCAVPAEEVWPNFSCEDLDE